MIAVPSAGNMAGMAGMAGMSTNELALLPDRGQTGHLGHPTIWVN